MLSEGNYFPDFLEPLRMAEWPLIAVIQEAYNPGYIQPHAKRVVPAFG
jgi:hypothetical protein